MALHLDKARKLDMNVSVHEKMVGWTLQILGSLGVLYALALSLIMVLLPVARFVNGAPRASDSDEGLVIAFVLLLLLIASPLAIGGWGLRRRKPWSIILVGIISCLILLIFPIGTLFGIYALWAIFGAGSRLTSDAGKEKGSHEPLG